MELTQLQAFVGPRLGRFPYRWGVLGISTETDFWALYDLLYMIRVSVIPYCL